MALEMKHRRHLLGQTFERLCKQASKMQQLRLNSSSFQLNVQAKLQSIVVRSWRQQVVSARTEQLALWNQTLKRKYFSLWSQTAGDQRKADRHYNFLLSQASLMIWRQRFEALKHRQTQQVFDDWLSGRLADEHSPTDPNENCSQRSNQTEKASQFRPAIEQSMHIRDIDEEISFIEDRLIEYQTEKESMQRDRKLLQSLCAVAGGKPSKQWKYDLLSQKLQRYDSDEVNRRQDVQALCNRLMELKSIVQRKL
jgi:hypothetical protein